MEQIFIGGHYVATAQATLCLRPQEIDAIVITDPGWLFPPFVHTLAKSYLHVEFKDKLDPSPEGQGPQPHQVQAMLDWSVGKERLLVACHQGISRSSAVAMLIAAREWGLDRCFEILTPGWHQPNRLILRIGSKLLGLPVYDAYGAWRRANGCDH